MQKHRNEGYILIESLVSLSLISTVLVLFVPFIVKQQAILHAEKTAVTLTRALYDYARGHHEQESITFSVDQSLLSEKVTAYDETDPDYFQTVHLLEVQTPY